MKALRLLQDSNNSSLLLLFKQKPAFLFERSDDSLSLQYLSTNGIQKRLLICMRTLTPFKQAAGIILDRCQSAIHMSQKS
jgi:hypothetical protein